MGWRLWPGVIAGLLVVVTAVGAQQHPAMFSAPRGSSARSDVSLPRATSAVSPTNATSVWVTGPLVKVLADAPAGSGQSLQISAAQNEFESFQVHLRATKVACAPPRTSPLSELMRKLTDGLA
jgi:hypothetical protein